MNAFMFEAFFTFIIIKAYRFQVQKEGKSSGGGGAVRENALLHITGQKTSGKHTVTCNPY